MGSPMVPGVSTRQPINQSAPLHALPSPMTPTPPYQPADPSQAKPLIDQAPLLSTLQAPSHHPRGRGQLTTGPGVGCQHGTKCQSTRELNIRRWSLVSKPPILFAAGTHLHQPRTEPSHGGQGPLSSIGSRRYGYHGSPTAPYASEACLINGSQDGWMTDPP